MSTLVQTRRNRRRRPNRRRARDRLRTQAAEASQVRALSTHPDVVALRVESVRTQVDRCMWVGIVLGLAFTMVNVQAFAAAGRGAVVAALVRGLAARPDGVAGADRGPAGRADHRPLPGQRPHEVDRPDEAVRVRRDLRDEHLALVPAWGRRGDRAALGAAAAGVLCCRDRPGTAGPADRSRPAGRADCRAGRPGGGISPARHHTGRYRASLPSPPARRRSPETPAAPPRPKPHRKTAQARKKAAKPPSLPVASCWPTTWPKRLAAIASGDARPTRSRRHGRGRRPVALAGLSPKVAAAVRAELTTHHRDGY